MISPARPPSGAEGPAGDPGRVLTIPNLITLARLLCLPVFLWLLLGREQRVAAAVLLAALGATDWIDGYIARHFDQQSDLGRLADPTVDRLLFFVGIGGIIAADGAPLWFCVVVLAREVTVAAITVVLTVLGSEPVHVTWFGKAGTFGLMCAFPLFLAGSSDLAIAPAWTVLAWICGIPALVLSYYAAFRYLPLWRANLRAARAGQADGERNEPEVTG